MSSLSLLVCEGIMNEAFFKNRSNHINQRVVHNPVTEVGGAYHPCFWVAHNKRFHRRRRVSEILKLFLQSHQIFRQIHLKLNYVILLCFSLPRPPEGKLKVFTGADARIKISVSFHAFHEQNPQDASPEGHSEPIGRPIVQVDVPPVVVVVQPVVVVAAPRRAPMVTHLLKRHLRANTAASLFQLV